MKNTTLTNQVSLIMDKLDEFPLDMVEIGITQSLLSSKWAHKDSSQYSISFTGFFYEF